MKNYTTKTAALNAVTVDTRILDSKKIVLNGKNILDYISDSEFNSYDTRDPQLKNDELDLWNTEISLSDNGHIEVKPHVHGISINEDTGETVYEEITQSQLDTLRWADKIINNEALDPNDEHLMYWQTDGLTDGSSMFFFCFYLYTFSSNLSSLTNGYCMFYQCNNLSSFSSDLSSLKDGTCMFYECQNLATFSSNLSSLTNGSGMFYECSLKSFSSDLSSLTAAQNMFGGCNNLSTFSSDLPSLTYGGGMFNYCKLDAKSVANIVHTLPTLETLGDISIGIGCDNTAEDRDIFAQECDCDTWQELLDDFSAKNWNVQFQCNGRPTVTYNMRRGEILPIYTKLEEVIMPTNEKERKPYYAYTSQDGTKFYNINYFHSTNGSTEGYDVFSSLEEAISTYNVTPKTNN